MQRLTSHGTKVVGYCLALVLALGSCARGSSEDSEPRSAKPSPLAVPSATAPAGHPPGNFEAAACDRSSGGRDGAFVHLTDVRVSSHDGFDRVTFEFQDPKESGGEATIPRYEIAPVKPPLVQDPSGEPLNVEGEAFLQIVFHGATGVDLSGESPRSIYRGPKELRSGLETLTEAQQQGDFEATLSWILGLAHMTCWRTLELQGPLRVAVDLGAEPSQPKRSPSGL